MVVTTPFASVARRRRTVETSGASASVSLSGQQEKRIEEALETRGCSQE